jgi:voltage-dependent potassium channel beta subunit
MQYRRLGRSGLQVSSLSLGSWLTIGNLVEQKDSEQLVRLAFDRGINLFDTADVYNRGEGERALGRAIRELPRQRVVLASKCYFPMSDDPNDRGLSRKHVVESLHQSLERLGTDYLDLYQCHRPDPDVPIEETAMAMDDLIRQGKLLYWGVSFWPAWRIAYAVRFCFENGLHAPISNQPPYSLLDRHVEDEVLPACERLGVGQIVYSPLAQGVLTGKYKRGAALPAGSRAADERVGHFVRRYLDDVSLDRVARFVAIADDVGRSPASLALAWVLRQSGVASAIVGASRASQLEDNLTALEIEMTEELAERIEAAFA